MDRVTAKKKHAEPVLNRSDSSPQSGAHRRNRFASPRSTRRQPLFETDEEQFNLLIDGVPYVIRAIPFLFNDELRYRVLINGHTEHLLVRDAETGGLRGIDDDSSVLPEGLEEALSKRLLTTTWLE